MADLADMADFGLADLVDLSEAETALGLQVRARASVGAGPGAGTGASVWAVGFVRNFIRSNSASSGSWRLKTSLPDGSWSKIKSMKKKKKVSALKLEAKGSVSFCVCDDQHDKNKK